MQNYCYSSVDEKSGVDLTGLNEVLAGLQSFLLALAEDLYLQPWRAARGHAQFSAPGPLCITKASKAASL